MKNVYKLLFLFALLVSTLSVQAQEYRQMIDAGTYSVDEIRANAEAYFLNRDQGRGSGYVHYKRWEYSAMRLMNEDGYLPTVAENFAEWERYNAYLNETASTRMLTNDNWTDLGPTSWNATSGWNPGLGRITGISVDKTNSNHIIIGGESGGVWRTTNGGGSWAPLNDTFANMSVESAEIDPSNSSTYYFGTNGGMIFKSTDSGATWNPLGNVGFSSINRILIHPTDSNIMFASAQWEGIYRSIDAGTSWQLVVAETNGYDVEFSPGNPMTVYASGSGFHKSIDGGATFNTIGGFNNGPKMIGVAASDPTRVYVIEAKFIGPAGVFDGLYSSSDTGSSFTKLDHGTLNFFGYSTTGADLAGQAPSNMDVTVNPTNHLEVHIAGILTWRSMDGGVNFTCTADWTPGNATAANIGYCHADVQILLFEGTTLYAGTDGGIFKATNTGNLSATYYTDIGTGLGIRQFYKIGISQTPNVLVSGGSQDNGTSAYTAALGWRDWLGADGFETFIDKNDQNTLYGTTQNGGLSRSDDGAQTRADLPQPGPGGGEWSTPFEQHPVLANTIFVGFNFVYKSTDKGENWNAASQDFGGKLDHLKISPSNPQIMYAADSDTGMMYKTVDGGATNWATIPAPGGNSVNSIAIHPTDPNKVAVASISAENVYVSTDGGATWVSYKKNLPNFNALAVVWDDNGADALYVGMNYGIHYIDNNLANWLPYSNNLPNVRISELEINSTTSKIYASSYGRGLWVSQIQDSNLGVESALASNNVQIYPNPTNSEINISMATSAEVDIRIFDLSGKLLVYEADRMIENAHSVDVSALTSGIYFIRINSESGEVTKKIIKN